MRKALIAVVLLGLLSAAAVAGPPKPRKPGKPAPPAGDSQELLAILNDTESVETFLTALETIAATDPQCQGLLPAAIRNADRLHVLKKTKSGDPTEDQQQFRELLDSLVEAQTAEKSDKFIPMAKLTLPSPQYLEHPPQFIQPDPDFPLPRELAKQDADKQAAATIAQKVPTAQDLTPVMKAMDRIEGRLDGFEAMQAKLKRERELEAAMIVADWVAQVFGVRLINFYSSDPNERMDFLLSQSEDERQLSYEWRRIWFKDQPQDLNAVLQRLERIEKRLGDLETTQRQSGRANSDPNERMQFLSGLLNQSEDSGPLRHEPRHYWFSDPPSYMPPERIHGGIMP